MSSLSQITPLIITYNEGSNLGRTLDRLAWAKKIVIVDSFSTADTVDIACRFPQTQLVQREFDSFASQCNFGLQQIRTPWVLSLDADYLVSEPLAHELGQLRLSDETAGYRASFRYW